MNRDATRHGVRALRRPVVVVTALAALSVAAGLSGCTGGGGTTPTATPTATSSATSSATASSSAPTSADSAETRTSTQTPTTAPQVGISTAPPVPAGSPADFGDGLVAEVVGATDVDVEAGAPGEVAGPAIAVTLVLRNGSAAAVDLSGVSVTAASVSGVPLEQTTANPSSLPRGVLSTGDEVKGTWVFSAPRGTRAGTLISVESASSPTTVQTTL